MEAKTEGVAAKDLACGAPDTLDKAHGDAYAASRFRALSVAFPGISHDMRGQLNNIVFNLELMKCALEKVVQSNSAVMNIDAVKYRDVTVKQVRQLDRTIQSLLELLDVGPGNSAAFDLSVLIDDVHLLLKTHARHKKIKLVWPPTAEAALFTAPRADIKRALFHIFLTIIDGINPQCTLTVATARSDQGFVLSMQIDKTAADEVFLETLQADVRPGSDSAFIFHKSWKELAAWASELKFDEAGGVIVFSATFLVKEERK